MFDCVCRTLCFEVAIGMNGLIWLRAATPRQMTVIANALERSESLSEEELALFDILLQSAPDLSDSDRAKVKQSARELVERIKELLVLNWQQKFDARAKLKVVIEEALDIGLPRAYTPELYQQKCQAVYAHIEQAYPERDSSVYAGL